MHIAIACDQRRRMMFDLECLLPGQPVPPSAGVAHPPSTNRSAICLHSNNVFSIRQRAQRLAWLKQFCPSFKSAIKQQPIKIPPPRLHPLPRPTGIPSEGLKALRSIPLDADPLIDRKSVV